MTWFWRRGRWLTESEFFHERDRMTAWARPAGLRDKARHEYEDALCNLVELIFDKPRETFGPPLPQRDIAPVNIGTFVWPL